MTGQIAFRLGRVSNLPTIWTNVLAAAVLAGAPLTSLRIPLVALACSLFYTGGMFLNDAFDRELDARVRPERPIPSGAASAAAVFVVGFGLLGSGLAAIIVAARWSLGAAIGGAVTAALALVGLIVLYDAWHKNNPIGPLLMGLCRVFVYVTAAVVLTGDVSLRVLGGAALLLSYLMGLTYVARQENLAAVRQLWSLGLLAMPFLAGVRLLLDGGFGALLYLGFLAWVLSGVSHLGWRARLDVPRAVVSLIAGVSLLDALVIAGQGATMPALLAVLGFALTLVLQRWVPGT